MNDYTSGRQYSHPGECLAVGTSAEVAFAENRFSKLRWDRDSIVRNAPEAPGVYGLFNVVWIYIGESENIKMDLLEHLSRESPRIQRYGPEGFAFELAPNPIFRHRRQVDLVRQLQPLAQRRESRKSHAD
jgi:hypothetical protein